MINLGKLSSNGKEVILQQKENGCLECISHCKDSCGYTRVFINGKHERLFRYIYEQQNGKIPKGMVIRHMCDNSSCCNINHLEIGTQLDNIKDRELRGRTYRGPNFKSRGTKSKWNKLTENQVKEIYLSNLSSYKLSEIYNVSHSNILQIKNKLTWKWLTNKIDKEILYEKNM